MHLHHPIHYISPSPSHLTLHSHLTKMASSFTTVLLLLLPILMHHTSTACHVDDESALLSFKSGFTQDPSGVFRSWVPNTDCCSWAGVLCGTNNRVNSLGFEGFSQPGGNYLSGTLSTSLTKLRYLADFTLAGFPNITGPFPAFLSSLPDLRVLNIQNTGLSGRIPNDSRIRFAKLEVLGLSGNRFSGTIPNSLGRNTNLYSLFLGENKLTGPIPPGIRQLKKLAYLYVEKNRLSGSPVKLLNQTTSLTLFTADGNKFRFNISNLVIPETLRYLNLSRNQVYGKVPASIARLDILDLSHNHLCGRLPRTNFSAQAFEGNDCLCGSPLPACKN